MKVLGGGNNYHMPQKWTRRFKIMITDSDHLLYCARALTLPKQCLCTSVYTFLYVSQFYLNSVFLIFNLFIPRRKQLGGALRSMCQNPSKMHNVQKDLLLLCLELSTEISHPFQFSSSKQLKATEWLKQNRLQWEGWKEPRWLDEWETDAAAGAREKWFRTKLILTTESECFTLIHWAAFKPLIIMNTNPEVNIWHLKDSKCLSTCQKISKILLFEQKLKSCAKVQF